MRYVLAVAAVLIAFASALGFSREYAAALTVRDTQFRVMEKLADQAPTAPGSWRGIRNVMLGCYDSQTSFALQFQPTEMRIALNGNCAKTASEILASAPSASVAHLVLAAAAVFFNDTGFSEHLYHSQATAAREGWLIARRHDLAARNFSLLDDLGQDVWSLDTATLLKEHWGRNIVAETFVALPELRPLIEELVEQLPNADQRSFVGMVREKTAARQIVPSG